MHFAYELYRENSEKFLTEEEEVEALLTCDQKLMDMERVLADPESAEKCGTTEN